MSTSLLATKLHFPQARSNLVSRPRLTRILEQGLRGSLTVISAPAGYGKTTLMSEWRASCGNPIPVGWLSLDTADNDPLRFLTYLTAALEQASPGLVSSTDSLLGSRQPPPFDSQVASLLESLSALRTEIVLILDDYHVITNIEIHQALDDMLEHLPPELHLVILTRADPAFPLSRMRVRNQLTEIRSTDLRFTEEEIRTFLSTTMGLDLSPEQIALLEARTEGWIAGLQLAGLSMQKRGDLPDFISSFTGSHHYIVDYLMEEVLQREPEAIQQFLLRTSILDRMNASLCNAVTGRTDSQAVLEYLEQRNLFLVPLDESRNWYRYHHLFSDQLRAALPGLLDTEETWLLRRASEWCAEHDLIQEAFQYSLQARDFERAASLVERYALSKIQRGELASLYGWLKALPETVVLSRPWLCVFMALEKYWAGPRDETEKYAVLAEQALAAASSLSESERNHIAGYIAAVRALCAIQNEDVPTLFDMAQKATSLIPEVDYVRALCGLALSVGYWGRGDAIRARQVIHEAKLIAMKIDHPMHVASCAYYESLQQLKQGQLSESYQTLQQALQWVTKRDKMGDLGAGCLMIRMSDLLREWNRLEEATVYLKDGMELNQRAGFLDYMADAYIIQARLSLIQEDLAGARETIARMEELASQIQFDAYVFTWLDECRLRLWAHTKNAAAIDEWLERSELSCDGELNYLHDLDHLNLARVLVSQLVDQPSRRLRTQVMHLLTRLLLAAEKAGWVHEAIKTHILQAFAAEKQEDALGYLAQALAKARPGGYLRMFLDEGAPMLNLLRRAAAKGMEAGYVADLLAAFSRPVEPVAGPPRPSIELLSPRELEVLHRIASGCTNKQIATELVIAIGTVKRHTVNIFNKLGVENRTEAVARARELGIL